MTPRPRHGFTLVEAIAAMVVVATLGSIASGLIFSGVWSYRDAFSRSQLTDDGSAALERICAELRACPADPAAGETAPLISSVTATSIDWNGNSSLTLAGSQLLLSDSGGAPAPLLTGVTSLSIQCYDESNDPLAASLSGAATHAIRRVSFTISTQTGGVSQTFRTRVFLRSMMLGAAP